MSTSTLTDTTCSGGGAFVVSPEPLLLKPGARYGFTKISDVHIGAAGFDRGPLLEELQEARIQGDRIHLNGDIFDCIIPSDKKRFNPSALAYELRGRDDVVNAQLELGLSLFGPYADLIDSVALGNHESSLTKYGGVDVLRLFVDELNAVRRSSGSSKGKVHYAGMCGFIDQRFANHSLHVTASLRGFYHHGSGSSAVKNLNAMLRTVENVDYFWLGHHHRRSAEHLQRISCNPLGPHIHHRQVRVLFTGAYLRSYDAQADELYARMGRQHSYQSDALMSPNGLGGARLLVKFSDDGLSYSLKVLQ